MIDVTRYPAIKFSNLPEPLLSIYLFCDWDMMRDELLHLSFYVDVVICPCPMINAGLANLCYLIALI